MKYSPGNRMTPPCCIAGRLSTMPTVEGIESPGLAPLLAAGLVWLLPRGGGREDVRARISRGAQPPLSRPAAPLAREPTFEVELERLHGPQKSAAGGMCRAGSGAGTAGRCCCGAWTTAAGSGSGSGSGFGSAAMGQCSKGGGTRERQ
jgi:hypothetical protein